jgi:hypothetical protein
MTRSQVNATTQQSNGGAMPPFLAGKNFLANGNFDIWQRSTSSTSTGYQTADRWYVVNSAATTTWSRESSIVPVGSTYSMKISQATNTSVVTTGQVIESLNAVVLAGKTVTLSFQAAASASTVFNTVLYYSTSTDNPASGSWTLISPTTGGSGTATTTSSFTTISGVYAIPSNAKTLYAQVYVGSLTAGTSGYFSQIQLEQGPVATPFSRAAGTLQGELALCQRYFEKSYYSTDAPGTVSPAGAYVTTGTSATTGALSGLLMFQVNKRIAPTMTFYDNAGTSGKCTRAIIGGADSNNEVVTSGNSSQTQLLIYSLSGASKTFLMCQWTASAEL